MLWRDFHDPRVDGDVGPGLERRVRQLLQGRRPCCLGLEIVSGCLDHRLEVGNVDGIDDLGP